MRTAQKARELAESFRNFNIKELIRDIEQEIEDAIATGKMYVIYTYRGNNLLGIATAYQKVKEELSALGYQVKIIDHTGSIQIEW